MVLGQMVSGDQMRLGPKECFLFYFFLLFFHKLTQILDKILMFSPAVNMHALSSELKYVFFNNNISTLFNFAYFNFASML